MDRKLRGISAVILIIGGLTLLSVENQVSILNEIKFTGKLAVATRNSPTTYYEGSEGSSGFEYDLVKRFADELGVELEITIPQSLDRIISMVTNNEIHFAAAGLTVTDARKQIMRFTSPYQHVTQQLIYRTRTGLARPRKITDLFGREIEVVADSSHAERLKTLKEKYPELDWEENTDLNSEELLDLVSENMLDHTIADSNEIAINRRFYPELRIAFNISPKEPIAWAFPKSNDNSLFNAATLFIDNMRRNGEIERILERYYGHVMNFDYVGTRTYKNHINRRLPSYREQFEKAGKENGIDWRLLAAMAYQESHWNPRARSPTGVRGLMMLTQNTAKLMKIENRLDPAQSIDGGSRYIKRMIEKIPEQIKEPDRTWMAMASYNVGYGHLEDARVITQIRGGNPDSWNDVKENLPLLTRKKWYKNTKHGYARGWEPVRYVENIRSYYDLLVWHTEGGEGERKIEPKAVVIDSPVL
ncbi:MAG: membrane-bound lytic murein transglycosylase MltF [Gammaproteobacteria bacterium]|nr:membrane-bound lytic murein transglycosylase MltF [Gammaproteobacteria bacterium]MDH5614033.1 membrane-bound lytic murein transglycosylase MltF [Gammaproteobacteria bacterium]